MQEVRKFMRFNCSVKVNYDMVDEYANPKDAYVRDVSRGGLGLILNETLPTQSKIKLHIQIPREKEPIEAVAEVIWVRKDLEKNIIHTGLRFIKISPHSKSILLEHAYECWKQTAVTKKEA